MATRLWKCFFCNPPKGHDFEAEKPVCPKCGLDGDHPKSRGAVAPRVVIHFDPPGAHPMFAENALACQPDKAVGAGGTMATGDPREVSCPACRRTAAFARALDLYETPEKYRVPPVPAPPAE